MPTNSSYLILPNYSSSIGGPGTFYRRFQQYFQSSYNLSSTPIFNPELKFLLIINGTRRLDILFLALYHRVTITIRLGSYYRSNIFTEQTRKAQFVHFFRTLLVIIALLCSSKVIFQSETVRDEWTSSVLGFLFYKKKLFTIYNSVPVKLINSFPYKYTCDEHINLVSLEANHCPLANSFPFYLFQELNKSGVKCSLHIFGNLACNEVHLLRSYSHNLFNYGFIPLNQIHSIVSKLRNPLYVVEDNFPCGCPNSMLEIQGIGVPSVTLDHTVASELINKFETGVILPTTKENLKKGTFPAINSTLLLSQLSTSYNFYSSNCNSMSTALAPELIFNAYFQAILGD